MASRGDDVFSRERGGGDLRGGTRPRRPQEVRDEAASAAAPEAANAAARSGMFGSTRLSGGSFKGRFPTGSSSAAGKDPFLTPYE